jgi:hypothetical protein
MRTPSPEVQALIFFGGCTLAGVLFIVLAILGSIPDRGCHRRAGGHRSTDRWPRVL